MNNFVAIYMHKFFPFSTLQQLRKINRHYREFFYVVSFIKNPLKDVLCLSKYCDWKIPENYLGFKNWLRGDTCFLRRYMVMLGRGKAIAYHLQQIDSWKSFFEYAFTQGNLKILHMLNNHPKKILFEIYYVDNLECLKFLHQQNFPLGENFHYYALEHRQFDIVKWLHQNFDKDFRDWQWYVRLSSNLNDIVEFMQKENISFNPEKSYRYIKERYASASVLEYLKQIRKSKN